MNKHFSQELKSQEQAGANGSITSTQTSVAEDLYNAAEHLEEDFELADDEDWTEAYLDRLKEARSILHGCRAKQDTPEDVKAILHVCEKNCDVFIDAIGSGEYPDGFEETCSRTIVLLLGTANALTKGNMDTYIKTLSGQVPYIFLANDSLGDADKFVRAAKLCRPSDGGWIGSFVGGVLCNNYEYVHNYLLQNIDPAEEDNDAVPPIDGVNSLLWTIQSVLSIDDVDPDVKDMAIYLITEAMLAQVKAVKAANNPDASLDTPVEGILPLTFYSFEYIDERHRKSAAA